MQVTSLLPRAARLHKYLLMALLALGGAQPLALYAQGGPPLVTDDPDTPPSGHWEINLAAIGSASPGLRQLALPDADINYGYNDHTQLKIDTPWLLSEADGGAVQSGLGASQLGVKYRFIDAKTSGFSMSTYPQVSINFLPSSYRRGITPAGKLWFLPLEASTEVSGFALDGEVGRYISSTTSGSAATPDAWAAGFIVSHNCLPQLECLMEIRETAAPHDSQTLFNIAGRRQFGDSLALMFALGRDVGPASSDHQSLLFYLGMQILR